MNVVNDLSKVQFPIFAIHTDNVELIDGILWIEDEVLDDRNMPGATLGIRRLQTPMKSLYSLRLMLSDQVSVFKRIGKFYIDYLGRPFIYEKRRNVQLKYHRIRKQEKKEVATVLWVNNIPFPFTLTRPLQPEQKWAGILYDRGLPWLLYETTTTKKRDSWRKV